MNAEGGAILDAIVTAIGQVLRDTGREARPMEPAALLAADLGLDSLDLAQTIVLLERSLGIDPFRDHAPVGDRPSIRTVADLVAIYGRHPSGASAPPLHGS